MKKYHLASLIFRQYKYLSKKLIKVASIISKLILGCGRKRNFHENPIESQDMGASGSIRLPIFVYKALLRAAAQNIRNTIQRDINDYQSGVPQVYLSGRIPLHKRFDMPSTSLN